MKLLAFRSLSKVALGLLLASGLATGAVVASAQPAQAGVVVSVGFGGGYAPGPAYHWHRWHDGYGWHRQWVPIGWAPPGAYVGGPVYPYAYGYRGRVGYVGYARPYFAGRYAPAYYGGRGYGYGWDRRGYHR